MTIHRSLQCLAVGGAALLSLIQVARADRIALKRDAGLVHADPAGTGNSDASVLHATFQALGAGDVTLTTVKDTFLNPNNMASSLPWYNYGASTNAAGSGEFVLYAFDLSVVPGFRGGTIIRAELRHYFTSGNTGYRVGHILTGWSEGNKLGAFPGSDPAAPGASYAHPNGLNTGRNQADGSAGLDGSWKSGFFAAAGAVNDSDVGLDGDMARSRKSGSNSRWHVYDVTDIAQSWANGTTNHGFWYRNGNYSIRLSEAGTERQPVLFIDYTPAKAKGTLILLR